MGHRGPGRGRRVDGLRRERGHGPRRLRPEVRLRVLTAATLDLLPLYPVERGELLSLLEGLKPDEWAAPTECPAWSVKGIALHVLGDDLSLLSRQRDEEAPGVSIEPGGSFDKLFVLLDRFNERWVEAASFFSPAVLIELLRMSGQWTLEFYGSIDGERLGEPVHWAGPDPAPYWLLAAREYWERWIHQEQIRRAVGRPGLHDAGFVVPAVAVAVRGFPQGLAAFPASDGTTITLTITDADGAAWTVGCDGHTWTLYDGAADAPTVTLGIDLETAALLFSRALTNAELTDRVQPQGDPDLGAVMVAGLAAFFARTS
ncbi:MAG: maleylpyruvate isomerase family mycothiol-dependent enzyme [Acidimicrobiia bacterium]|nr:maleylpyruvate isomerase family mycothiol-dependent enzyme [Acidimicrobiia bacterium]